MRSGDRASWRLIAVIVGACVASAVWWPLGLVLLAALNGVFFGALGGVRCCVLAAWWLDAGGPW